jgi:succinyl-CoA synthetase beta subunit
MGLLSKYGIPVPQGQLAKTPEEAYRMAESFGMFPWMGYNF